MSTFFSYQSVRRSSAIWAGRPSGLGHYDIALYIFLGKKFERESAARGNAPYWVLDLGTYFGHSAFAVAYGASLVSKNPSLNVLSIDLFEQPKYLLENVPEVIQFVKEYGSTGPEAIGRRLDLVCGQIGLKRNPIRLMKQDVFKLSAQDLAAIAPEGFKLISVDCAKMPDVMNRVGEFLADPLVCRPGTTVLFQDLFDWHAPWNAFAFWRLMEEGVISVHEAGTQATPLAEKLAKSEPVTLCDRIGAPLVAGEAWSTPFTSLENEIAALDGLSGLFRRRDCIEFALRLECLKVGAFLRAGQPKKAEELINVLDRAWPEEVRDTYLQNAYCRTMHMKTGQKNLSLVFDTPRHRSGNSFRAQMARRVSGRLLYFKPIALSA